MKLHAQRLLILLALIFAISVTATAQTTSNSTSTSPAALSDAQRKVDKEADAVVREADALRMELRIRRLIDEVKGARQLIAKQREELAAADKQLDTEKENSSSLEKTNKLLSTEGQHLLKAAEGLMGSLQLEAQAKRILKQQNSELKRSVGKWKKRSLWATLAAGAVTGILILK